MAEVEEEAPSKGGLIKIILMVLVVLLIAVGSALGALFFTGFFEEKEADAAEEAIAELEAEIEETDAVQMPEKVSKETAEEEKVQTNILYVRPTFRGQRSGFAQGHADHRGRDDVLR
jgi:flagellar FliL protein